MQLNIFFVSNVRNLYFYHLKINHKNLEDIKQNSVIETLTFISLKWLASIKFPLNMSHNKVNQVCEDWIMTRAGSNNTILRIILKAPNMCGITVMSAIRNSLL